MALPEERFGETGETFPITDCSCSDGYVKEKQTSVLFRLLLVIGVSGTAALFRFTVIQELSWGQMFLSSI